MTNQNPCQTLIHFNNAGAALMPAAAYDAMLAYLDKEQRYGGYETAVNENNTLTAFYDNAATLIDADASQIALLQNASQAFLYALLSVPLEKEDTVLVSSTEYTSNYVQLKNLQTKIGFTILPLGENAAGEIELEALARVLKQKKIKLLCVTHIPSNNGLINPVVEIAELLKETQTYYIVDAAQSLGQIPISVKQLGCDFLFAPGRKYLRGPRGTALLYSRDKKITQDLPFYNFTLLNDYQQTPYPHLNTAARFELWEKSPGLQVGLNGAIEHCLQSGVDKVWQTIQKLSGVCREKLNGVEGIHLFERGQEQSGIITFAHQSIASVEIKKQLEKNGINVSLVDPAYQLNAALHDDKIALRASLHSYNTHDEINQFVSLLKGFIK